MNRFMQAIKDGFTEGRQRAKSEARLARARKESEVKVIVFESTGEVKLATLCGNRVCRENLTNYEPMHSGNVFLPKFLHSARK